MSIRYSQRRMPRIRLYPATSQDLRNPPTPYKANESHHRRPP